MKETVNIPLESEISANPSLSNPDNELLKDKAIHRELELIRSNNLLKFKSRKVPFLLNKEGYEEMVGRKLETYKGSFAIIFFDGDNFKNINDTHGHEFGDEAILEMGKAIVNSTRRNTKTNDSNLALQRGESRDILGHVGGDEFCVLLMPEDGKTWNSEDARKAAQAYEYRIFSALNKGYTSLDNEDYRVTVKLSMTGGVYLGDTTGESIDVKKATNIADERLKNKKLEKKKEGKNFIQLMLLEIARRYRKSHGFR